jgi:hypothetical protein
MIRNLFLTPDCCSYVGKFLGTPSGCYFNFICYQGWRAEAALTPGYFLSPLRGDCRASFSIEA